MFFERDLANHGIPGVHTSVHDGHLYRMPVILYQSANQAARIRPGKAGTRMKAGGARPFGQKAKTKNQTQKEPALKEPALKESAPKQRAPKIPLPKAAASQFQAAKFQTQSQVQVIARAAAILRSLEDEAAGLSLGQIAQRVNLARSTVQRIVAALEAEKFLIAASPNGRVRLGPTILRLAGSARTDFVAVARPYLLQLSNELKETVDLSMVKKDHLVFIDQVIGSQRLRTVSAVGETFPLYCTANGKAYLAGLDDTAVARLIGTTYEPRTPRTLTRLDDLLRDLKAVRKAGVAIDREEHTHGICAAGIVTRDPAGNAVAISVPVPAQRFYDHEQHIVARLRATKEALERHLMADAA
jgi:DNA-binding IclR family transcriptional regulator